MTTDVRSIGRSGAGDLYKKLNSSRRSNYSSPSNSSRSSTSSEDTSPRSSSPVRRDGMFHPKSRQIHSSHKKNDHEFNRTLSILKAMMHYHATTNDSAESILTYGFSRSRKTEGLTHLAKDITNVDREAGKYHYLTKSHEEAAWYAKMYLDKKNANDPDSMILRVLLPLKYQLRLIRDPQQSHFDKAFRTSSFIPSKYILSPSMDRDLFHQRFKRICRKINKELSIDEIARLESRMRAIWDYECDEVAIKNADSFVQRQQRQNDSLLQQLQSQHGPLTVGQEYSIVED